MSEDMPVVKGRQPHSDDFYGKKKQNKTRKGKETAK